MPQQHLDAVNEPPTMTFQVLRDALNVVRAQTIGGAVYEPDALCVSIDVQGRAVQNAWLHRVSSAGLESRLSELLCDIVHLGELLNVDLEAGVRRILAQGGETASSPRPSRT